jgi:hypothetical protein
VDKVELANAIRQMGHPCRFIGICKGGYVHLWHVFSAAPKVDSPVTVSEGKGSDEKMFPDEKMVFQPQAT